MVTKDESNVPLASVCDDGDDAVVLYIAQSLHAIYCTRSVDVSMRSQRYCRLLYVMMVMMMMMVMMRETGSSIGRA